jgi:Ca2+-binding RTX toxin-like protein
MEESMPPIFALTNSNDDFLATNGDDIISGKDGSDQIRGGDGNDVIYGHSAAELATGSSDIVATRVATALERPVFATSAPGRPNDLFIVEAHTGKIKILDIPSNTVSTTPFLDIPQTELRAGSEEGLLGLAFHPNYATNGKFYVYHNTADGNIVIEEYLRSATNPNVADLSSKKQIIGITHPFSNHNGGWIGFGQDGMLYAAVGDGGSSGDPNNNAQNLNSLLGKMLRLDVNGDAFPDDASKNYAIPYNNPFAGATAGADEIWAFGLRNPWRPSFDRQTGDLYIADVGQGLREEINFQLANSTGGANYGWKVMEGSSVYNNTTPGNPPVGSSLLTGPIHEYSHGAAPNGGFSVTGGYVYRGTSAGLQGQYFFADFVTNQIWTFKVENGVATQFSNRTAQIKSAVGPITNISSFAEDAQGNLYVVTLGGGVFRLAPGISAGDGNDLLFGGNGNDKVYGGRGDDTLYGDAGNDLLTGGLGADDLFGGTGSDTLILSGTRGVGVTANLLQGFGLGGEAEGDSYAEIENIIGSHQDDVLTLSNVAGRLDGYNGSDVLNGGNGADIFFSGGGADQLTGGGGVDRAFYSGSIAVNINLLTNVATGGDAQGDTFNSIEELSGSSAGDTFIGNNLANRFFGQNGDDVLAGGAGIDTLVGGAGSDTFRFALGDTGLASATNRDLVQDYTRGAVGAGDKIDLVSGALSIGGTAAAATATQASINASTGVATFLASSGTTMADALADIVQSFTTGGNAAGEFALFQVNGSGDHFMLISDGIGDLGANDVLIQLGTVTTPITGIDLTAGDLTVLT